MVLGKVEESQGGLTRLALDVAARDNLWRVERGRMEGPSDVGCDEVKYNV